MTDQEKKQKMVDEISSIRSQRKEVASTRLSDVPLVVGDVLTFSLKNKEIKDVYHYQTAQTVTRDGKTSTINGYMYFTTVDGRPISQSQIARRGNGLELAGNTPDEKADAFIEMVANAKDATVNVTVSDIRETRFGSQVLVFTVA